MITTDSKSTRIWRLLCRFSAAMLLSVGATASVNAASFDCAQASSRIDNAICASPQLSKLDDDLDAAYKAALAKNGDPDAVKTAQRAWLKETRNQCADEVCLLTVYQQRIAALNASVAPDANAKPEMREDTEAAEDAADANEAAAASAQKAAAAASAAQAQKVAEQAAAATSAAKANELVDKAAAELHFAEQKRFFEFTGGAVALLVLIVGFLLFRPHRRTAVKAAQKQDTQNNGSTIQVEKKITTINETKAQGAEAFIASTSAKQAPDVIARVASESSKSKTHPLRIAKIAKYCVVALLAVVASKFVIDVTQKVAADLSSQTSQKMENTEEKYYAAAGNMKITPFISMFEGMRFGQSAKHLPKGFNFEIKDEGQIKTDENGESLYGFPRTDCYINHNPTTELQNLEITDIVLCFDNDKLLNVTMMMENTVLYLDMKHRIDQIAGHQGLRNKDTDNGFIWNRSNENIKAETLLTLIPGHLVYMESLDHKHSH